MRFNIFIDRVGEYRWNLVAANNEIIACSEGYTSKQSAVYAVKLILNLSVNTPIYDLT